MTECAYGNFQTDRIYENNDDFDFPSALASNLVNPIVWTVNSWSVSASFFKVKMIINNNNNNDNNLDLYST